MRCLIFGAKDFGMRIWLDPEPAASARESDDRRGHRPRLREQNVQVAAGKIGEQPNSQKASTSSTPSTTQGRL